MQNLREAISINLISNESRKRLIIHFVSFLFIYLNILRNGLYEPKSIEFLFHHNS